MFIEYAATRREDMPATPSTNTNVRSLVRVSMQAACTRQANARQHTAA